jgi:hypothetical protein|tara:strand:+ start:325 stop:810 length:486 start_codon:yes stop_codon:yes gene_type:complete
MNEWRDIEGFDMYEVNAQGQVRRKAQILKPGAIPTGHLTVGLCRGKGKPKSMYVHRLVALAFLENRESKRVVNHKNGNPKDNRLENLEWATHSENNTHAYQSNGRCAPNELKVAAVDDGGEIVMSFRSGSEAARMMNVTTNSILSAINRRGKCKGYRWIKC